MQAWLGLGGNLGQPPRQFATALQTLHSRADTEVLAISPLYLSDALGPPQPDYTNSCCLIDTDLQADALYTVLKELEAEAGRQQGGDRWGPRPLDLDILLYGDMELRTANLTIPHRELHARRFVLQPLCDLDPDLTLPDGRGIRELLANSPDAPLRPCGWRINIGSNIEALRTP